MDKNKILELNEKIKSTGLILEEGEEGLTLTDGKMSLTADFSNMARRLTPGNLQKEMLIKAARLKSHPMPQTVLDATAGLGEDSILLAAAGFKVVMYEYDPVIAALLEDALRRAKREPLLESIVGRMELRCQDSIEAMARLDFSPDTVLLDPMFPARQKSGLIKKKFQLLQRLEAPCTDERDLLAAALATSCRRIVVKRPIKGALLAGVKPDYSLTGKAIRYDCFSRELKSQEKFDKENQ